MSFAKSGLSAMFRRDLQLRTERLQRGEKLQKITQPLALQSRSPAPVPRTGAGRRAVEPKCKPMQNNKIKNYNHGLHYCSVFFSSVERCFPFRIASALAFKKSDDL